MENGSTLEAVTVAAIVHLHYYTDCRKEFWDCSVFESFAWHVQVALVASDVTIEVCLMFVVGALQLFLISLLNSIFVHLFIVRVLSAGQRLQAIACGTRPVEHVLLVTPRAFAFACTTNTRPIIYALNFSASCD